MCCIAPLFLLMIFQIAVAAIIKIRDLYVVGFCSEIRADASTRILPSTRVQKLLE